MQRFAVVGGATLGERTPYASVSAARRRATLELVHGRCDDALPLEGLVRAPVFVGDGEVDHVCARCSLVLCAGIAPGDLAGVRVRCACGAVNVVTAAPGSCDSGPSPPPL